MTKLIQVITPDIGDFKDVPIIELLIKDGDTVEIDQPEQLPSLDVLRKHFEEQRLIGSLVKKGKAQVWTAFRFHEDGFARFLMYNRSTNKCETGRLVQKLLEVETYRLMALLALPLCKEAQTDIYWTSIRRNYV